MLVDKDVTDRSSTKEQLPIEEEVDEFYSKSFSAPYESELQDDDEITAICKHKELEPEVEKKTLDIYLSLKHRYVHYLRLHQ